MLKSSLLLFLASASLLAALPVEFQRPPNANSEWHLIKTNPNKKPRWMTDVDIQRELYANKKKFMDITFTKDLGKRQVTRVSSVPIQPTQMNVVKPMLGKANTALMKETLTKLTEFNTRYYRSSTGTESAEWLFGKVKEVVANSNTAGLQVSVTQFSHSWAQKSIIARIEGKNKNDETVIVGAHQDSINQWSPSSGRAPGADDDGSGTVTILEALRVLLTSGYQPLRPVELHWYSGEEAGLLGSQDIASKYANSGRKVAGMMQLDMTMFPNKENPDIGIVTDYVDTDLTGFLRKLIPVYTTLSSGNFQCGYACSDHASWNQAGYPAVIPFESSNMEENQNIHTPQDSLDTVNYDHGLQFVKLVVSFVVEMSHA